jgi:hypothetical protein
MSTVEQLVAAILAAGIGVEQLGLADGVRVVVDDDECVTLHLGEDGAESFDDVAAARKRIEAYAFDHGADPKRRGAIVELVARLAKLVATVEPERRGQALVREHYNDLFEVAEELGMDLLHELEIDGTEVTADDDAEIGFFIDGNDVTWLVFVEDGNVRYELFSRTCD